MSITIYNTDTNHLVELSIIDPESGCNWVADCIGNTCHGMATDAPDGVDVEATYYADGATVGWWATYLANQEAADYRLSAARQECTQKQLHQLDGLIADVSGDMEDHPAQIQQAIDEALGTELVA